MSSTMAFAVLFATTVLTMGVPAPHDGPSNPARPKPNWRWDTIPLAFHGANRSGIYDETVVKTLAEKYLMVTIEKWYTECGSKHPIQNGPWCDVEKAMFGTFNAIKELNPNVTTIMYLNSMFDFSMYNLAGKVNELEAAGTRVLLRDEHDKLVLLCNDGNYYCNVTNFDWSQQAAIDLWLDEVHNATTFGGVDGIFADHATAELQPPDHPTLCNGAGSGKSCWHFTPDFATKFNAGHKYLINHTQDILAPLGGPVVDGPYSRWHVDACDFDTLRSAINAGQQGTGPYVIEASTGACNPSESCLAGFLTAVQEYTYLACFSDEPTYYQNPAFAKPLGAPMGDAVEGPSMVWTRKFASGTTSTWYSKEKRGTVHFAGDPPAPPTPPPAPPTPPPPVDPQCGKVMPNTKVAEFDIAPPVAVVSAEACCKLCEANSKCIIWAWHAEMFPQMCHLHSAAATPHKGHGCFAGHMVNRTIATVM